MLLFLLRRLRMIIIKGYEHIKVDPRQIISEEDGKSLQSIKTEEIENSTINTGKSCPDTLKPQKQYSQKKIWKVHVTSNNKKGVSE